MENIIYDVAMAIEYVLKECLDAGTGVCYHNDVFEIHGFWQHEDDWYCVCEGFDHEEDCEVNRPLFHHYASGYKATWYKRIGRSYEDNDVKLRTIDKYKVAVECLESVRDDKNPEWRCKYLD